MMMMVYLVDLTSIQILAIVSYYSRRRVVSHQLGDTVPKHPVECPPKIENNTGFGVTSCKSASAAVAGSDRYR